MGTSSFEDLQQLLGSLRAILRRAAESELSGPAAIQRLESLLGPPVKTTPSPRLAKDPAMLHAYQQLVNRCRLALDRVRAGIVSPADGLEAIDELVNVAHYEETQADVHDITLEPLPPPHRKGRPASS
jgi:hypothetical protein